MAGTSWGDSLAEGMGTVKSYQEAVAELAKGRDTGHRGGDGMSEHREPWMVAQDDMAAIVALLRSTMGGHYAIDSDPSDDGDAHFVHVTVEGRGYDLTITPSGVGKPSCDCENPDVEWADIDGYWQCLGCAKIMEGVTA